MLIINADDYGRDANTTDRILSCSRLKRITSASAMVFMADSERAATLANENGLTTGLHINFTAELTGDTRRYPQLKEHHHAIAAFLSPGRFSLLFFNPFLTRQFRYVFDSQLEEYHRLFGRGPAHFDGHHHMHLCSNMLISRIMPAGKRVRRSFSFFRGEKGPFNRLYRSAVNAWLARTYQMTDYLFSLPECLHARTLDRVIELARTRSVELETHPDVSGEYAWLTSSEGAKLTGSQARCMA